TAANDRIRTFALDVLIDLHADEVCRSLSRNLHFQVTVLKMNLVGDIDRLDHVFVSERGILHAFFQLRIRTQILELAFPVEPETKRTQENRSEKLALADAHVK